jgi:hypothetical protein
MACSIVDIDITFCKRSKNDEFAVHFLQKRSTLFFSISKRVVGELYLTTF